MIKFKRIFSVVVIVFLVAACHGKRRADYVSIKGDVHSMAKELNGRTLYLTDVYNRSFVDSTVVIDGEFSFLDTSINDNFQPYLASIKCRDTIKNFTFLRPIGIQNPYNSTCYESQFYVDRGQNNGSNIRYSDSVIRAYPFSIYLLDQLYANKQYFSVTNLQFLLKAFSSDLRNSNTGKKFETYFSFLAQPDNNKTPQLFLPDETGKKHLVIESDTPCQLLVFWASWCGPCRREIPDLKNIYIKYKQKGLSITSISVDRNKNDWMTALAQEKMPWKQLLVDESARMEVDMKYNIVAVPSLFLIDKNQKIIKIADHHSIEELDSIVGEHLRQPALN
ncbi:TlpA disulfide reductase family protein [Chitinophagaceae bacterium 26-R-25]|nr:TlpA disulfide reductase family protein [Chitinophagaceae bacterium 26-R-25]